MYTCNTCKKKFNNYPFIAYPNSKKYCSFDCIPESAMEKPYSFQYFMYMDNVREIEESIENIKNINDRLELESDIVNLWEPLVNETYGDDEGLFYKEQLFHIFDILDELHHRVNNIFNERKRVLKTCVLIKWLSLYCKVGEDIYEMILKDFKENMKYEDYENLQNNVCKDRYIGESRDKLCVDTMKEARNIERIFKKSIKKFKSYYTEKNMLELDWYEDYISIEKLCLCPICEEWEVWEHFTFSEELNVYKCNYWAKCEEFNYEDYYKGLL